MSDDENPDFNPKVAVDKNDIIIPIGLNEHNKSPLQVGDQVWYDYNDDWVESKVVKVKGNLYTLEVDGVGLKENVKKSEMAPVEFEEDGEECDAELLSFLESKNLDGLSSLLSAAGIR